MKKTLIGTPEPEDNGEEDIGEFDAEDLAEKWVSELAVEKLGKDLIQATAKLGRRDVRFLVDLYYQIQEVRKRLNNQIKASGAEPNDLIKWYFKQQKVLEVEIVKALNYWTDKDPLAAWAKSITGIGPVIAAGLAAHIDFAHGGYKNADGTRAPLTSAGQIHRFAGLAPPESYSWKKGEKRPWNARLKVLCWKIGDSFVKNSGRGFLYGDGYRLRKGLEVQRNESGECAEVAKKTLAEKNFKSKEAKAHYEAGRLPPGRVDNRARRWAVKLFLSHYFEQGFRLLHGKEPPAPYPIQHLGHVKWIRADEAISGERTDPSERAELPKRTGQGERAVVAERTAACERAVAPERTVRRKRAKFVE